MSSTLSRDAILAATDLQLQPVEVPEWGGLVYIRPMSGAERDSFDSELVLLPKEKRMDNMRARTVVRTVCNEQGVRLFSDADVAVLGAKSAAALDRIFQASQRLSRLGEDAVADLGNASGGAPSAASGSVSP